MKTFFKILMYIIIILLICAGVVAGILVLERPLVEAGILLAGIFGTWVLFILVRKAVIRHRAKKQIQRILQNEAPNEDIGDVLTPQQLLKEMRSSWKTVIRALKKSHLKLKGDPLYVLPWYMVIGKPRSGKSTSLKNAKLLSPEIELPEHAQGSTLNLDWWLFEQAIVIDTAGRYAVPDEKQRDRKEWSALLEMLAKHKHKEPINGLVLVVAADRLLNNNEEELIDEGVKVRASIHELMEKLEIQVPVYLMITKCDLIEGFSSWCQYLPKKSMLQSMGYLIEDDEGSVDDIVDHALDTVLDRIKELRLLMLERSSTHDDSLLTLPSTMEGIRSGLHHFIKGALKDNPYQEAPIFRGMFFSTSQQAIQEGSEVVLKDNGVFLHDIYTRILPADRGILETLPSSERLRRAFKTFIVSLGGGLTLFALSVLSATFSNNLNDLDHIKSSFSQISLEQRDINEQILSLNRLRQLIIDLDEVQSSWIIPWNGSFGPSNQLFELKLNYIEKFRGQIIKALDEPLKRQVSRVRGEGTSILAGGLIRRINLLKAVNNLDDPQALVEKPSISEDYLFQLNENINGDAAELFNELYLSYLTWNTENLILVQEKDFLQAQLVKLIERNHGDYRWVIDWANAQGNDTIRLDEFWPGSIKLKNPPSIESAYTLDGRDFIERFLTELAEANDEGSGLGEIKAEFEGYYRTQYVRAWVEFTERFSEGAKQLRDRKEWISAVEQMASNDNPYFAYMEKMSVQLKPFSAADIFPSIELVDYFKQMQAFAKKEGGDNSKLTKAALKLVGKAGKVGKLVAKAGKKGLKAKKKMGKGGVNLDALLEKSAKELALYKKAISDTAFDVESLTQSNSTMATLFTTPDNPGSGNGPAASMYNAIINLQKIIGKPKSHNRLFWQLYKGPLAVIHDYMEKETGCYLQDQWSNTVLAETEGVTRNNLGRTLIGEQGLVWNYIDKVANPYLIKRFQKGYLPKKVKGRTVAWNDDFIQFVNKASSGRFIVGSEFSVQIKALPTGVNLGASISPYATFLTMHCADGVQELANYNYTGSNEFKWSLEKCGDVSLQIEIGHVRLRKNYDGVKGFSKFLADFHDGRRVFVAEEFPAQAAQLKNENVQAVDVNYTITGQEPVIQMLDAVPLDPPKVVAACW